MRWDSLTMLRLIAVTFSYGIAAYCSTALAEDDTERWFSQAPAITTAEARPSSLTSAPDAKNPATVSPPTADAESSVPDGVFKVLPGFQVELLYTVPSDTQGSWVSVTRDPQGRLIASAEASQGLYRITPSPLGTQQPTRVEKLVLPVTAAQGLLYAFDSLYLSINNGPESGLYRARDTNGQGEFGAPEKLKEIKGSGEHGPHGLRLSPDGKSIYLVCGNHTQPPENFSASRLPSNWSEDHLLPRQWDAGGHAVGILAPGGYVAKTDPDGQKWELVSSGYRNAYDIDFNADGELFSYDSDMEWDMGSPWYRPTRVVHATSGSEFGWRSGTGKWPPYYADSLPPMIDTGPGSPVGITFGYGAKFPSRYQQALFILDWTFGTIHAVHLTPAGASYQAEMEEFVARSPLPLTDATVGADGAFYFLVGGRGTQSELYRVTYVGKESTDSEPTQIASKAPSLLQVRRQLETYHSGHHDANLVVPIAFEQLGHADRHIRYAARIALEHQPVAAWQDRVLKEKLPRRAIHGAIALARQGSPAVREPLLKNLRGISWQQITLDEQLDLLRAYSLVCIRLGHPDAEQSAGLLQQFESLYPAKDWRINRELCSLLVYFESPTVIERTLALMQQKDEGSGKIATHELLTRNSGYAKNILLMMENQPQQQNIHYAFALRNMRYGWTLEQRRQYLQWLQQAKQWNGGHSYQGFIDNTRKDSLANATPSELAALESELQAVRIPTADLPKPQGPGREWTLSDVEQTVTQHATGRNFENGKRAFGAARCVVCHRIAGDGGSTGPDLTNVAGRFSYRDLTEAILAPSKVISDQYRAMTLTTTSGKIFTGRVTHSDDQRVEMLTDPEDPAKTETVAKTDVESLQPATQSLMPDDLLKPLNQDEVLDLFAYLLSRGNPNDSRFKDAK
ncbi:MAG: c-type cytochrome [Planctomycetota bacterium]|nr:c-type cytochrome [Planctomycetota bacterium]